MRSPKVHAGTVLCDAGGQHPVLMEGMPRSDDGCVDHLGERRDEVRRDRPDLVGCGHEAEHRLERGAGPWEDSVDDVAAVPGPEPDPLATSDCNVMAPRATATSPAPRPTLAQRTRNRTLAWRTGFSTTT